MGGFGHLLTHKMALTKRLKDAAKAGDCEVITDEINRGTYHVNSILMWNSRGKIVMEHPGLDVLLQK